MRIPKKSIFTALAIFAVIILVISSSKNVRNPARTKLLDTGSPVLKAFQAVSGALKRAIPFASLRYENKLLRSKVENLSRKIDEMKLVSEENARLRELLNFRRSIPYTTMPAQVIGRDPSNWSNSLIIDKGSIYGLRPNRAVISTKGLVGRLAEVGRNYSKVLLITDPNSKVGVLIQKNRQGGVLVGRPDGKCRIVYIALDSDVAPGDKVITAGFGAIFPKDIAVGEVVKVDKEPGRLYKTAVVKPSQDLSMLEEVLCIR